MVLGILNMGWCWRILLVIGLFGALDAGTVYSSSSISSSSRGKRRSLQMSESGGAMKTNSTVEDLGVVRFCCGEGFFFNATLMDCEPGSVIKSSIDIPFYDYEGFPMEMSPPYASVSGFPNCSFYALDPENPDDAFHLLPDGQLVHPGTSDILVLPDNYCLLLTESHKTEAIICFAEESSASGSLQFDIAFLTWLVPIGLIISSVFLIATLTVYILVSELRDLLGKCLMCSISALCLGQVTTASLQLGAHEQSLCLIAALLIQFCFLSAFTWLNVICVNVFLALCGRRGAARLWMYSLYAWGLPSCLTMAALIRDLADADTLEWLPKPNFGLYKCFFADEQSSIFYFYGPIAVILSINVVLFCVTAWKLRSINKKSEAKLFQFTQYLKLFILMGITWIFEVISYFAKTESLAGRIIWMIFDFINVFQGVIIFIFFVCRRPVLSRLASVFCGQDYAKRKYPDLNQVEDTEYINPGNNQGSNKQTVTEVQEDGIRLDGIK